MSLLQKTVHNALVLYDSANTNRWYDAFGEGVVKYLQSFESLPVDDTTLDPIEWVETVVEVGAGTSNIAIIDAVGGAAKITCAANEDDGWSMQLGGASGGESVQFNGAYPCYFGIRFQSDDADQSDFFAGLSVTDTAVLGGITDGVYFRSVDETGVLNFVIEKNSVESSTAVGTLADDTYITAEFYYDGANIMAYVDSVLMATIADTDASFPNDEALRLTIEYLTGEAVANTCTIDWVRLIQIRA